MILYDFKCLDCASIFEQFKRQDEDPPLCPTCGGKTEQAIVSPYIVRDFSLFARRRIPTDFKEGVLDRIKSKYPSAKKHFRE